MDKLSSYASNSSQNGTYMKANLLV